MKITRISVVLEPNETEKADGKEPITINRTEDKLWFSSRIDGGMLPYEIRLVNTLQEEVIGKFNTVNK